MIIVGKLNGLTIVKLSDVELALCEAVLSPDQAEEPAPVTEPTEQKGKRKRQRSSHVHLPKQATEILGRPFSTGNSANLGSKGFPTINNAQLTKNYLTFYQAADLTGFPDWHFRRAALNEKIKCWISSRGYVIDREEALILVSLMKDIGWEPNNGWNPKKTGSYKVGNGV